MIHGGGHFMFNHYTYVVQYTKSLSVIVTDYQGKDWLFFTNGAVTTR
jgi:hypothetical protein